MVLLVRISSNSAVERDLYSKSILHKLNESRRLQGKIKFSTSSFFQFYSTRQLLRNSGVEPVLSVGLIFVRQLNQCSWHSPKYSAESALFDHTEYRDVGDGMNLLAPYQLNLYLNSIKS